MSIVFSGIREVHTTQNSPFQVYKPNCLQVNTICDVGFYHFTKFCCSIQLLISEMYCLRLFIIVLQKLHCLPNCLHVSIIRVIGFSHLTKFRCATSSSFRNSQMYFTGVLIVFYKNCIVFTVIILACALKIMRILSFVFIGSCFSELYAPYRSVWPEAVYCCFTRTTLFTNKLICRYCH